MLRGPPSLATYSTHTEAPADLSYIASLDCCVPGCDMVVGVSPPARGTQRTASSSRETAVSTARATKARRNGRTNYIRFRPTIKRIQLGGSHGLHFAYDTSTYIYPPRPTHMTFLSPEPLRQRPGRFRKQQQRRSHRVMSGLSPSHRTAPRAKILRNTIHSQPASQPTCQPRQQRFRDERTPSPSFSPSPSRARQRRLLQQLRPLSHQLLPQAEGVRGPVAVRRA